jgi:hypothetical protein
MFIFEYGPFDVVENEGIFEKSWNILLSSKDATFLVCCKYI